jgi:Mrp family chromosome partitioning ATPase
MGESDIGSIAVTSTLRKEGRTTIAIGLAAVASSQLHRKTILLDLDLERGSIENLTSVGPGLGIVEVLYEDARIADGLHRVDQQVEVFRAGAVGQRSGLTPAIVPLGDLLHQLGDRCDVVIADLPPLSSGVAVARVADLFERVVLVVQAGRPSISEIEQTTLLLTQRPSVILNGRVPRRWPGRLLPQLSRLTTPVW